MEPAADASLVDWLRFLEALHPKGQAGIELGLERVGKVRDALGQTAWCPIIMVGGTNGKGSTCAYLERILVKAGVRVGCYTSPHLLRYNERVRLGGQETSNASLIRAFARVEAARRRAGDVALTYFEFGTLAAWEVFAEAALDAVILEIGLGGRLDAVNIYEPDVSIITGIALDHTDWLGPTREHIGREKAGIFRAGRPALCADLNPPSSLVDEAERIGAVLLRIGKDFKAEPSDDRSQWVYSGVRGDQPVRRALAYPALRGKAQLANAAVAIQALDCLRERLPVSMQAIRQGLLETELPGRFQIFPGRPSVVLDVAHNPQACAVLADNLGGMGFFNRTTALVGMLGDKDVVGALSAIKGRVDEWLVVPLDSPRALPPEQLAKQLRDLTSVPVHVFPSVLEACCFAASRRGETDRILAFGSFLTVAAVWPYLSLLRDGVPSS